MSGPLVGGGSDIMSCHSLAIGQYILLSNCLKNEGRTAWARNVLKILASTGASWLALGFRTQPGIRSGPAAFSPFTPLNTLLMSISAIVNGGFHWRERRWHKYISVYIFHFTYSRFKLPPPSAGGVHLKPCVTGGGRSGGSTNKMLENCFRHTQ